MSSHRFIISSGGFILMSNDEYKNCPFCNEEVKAIAIKCKHCHSFIGDGIDLNKTSIKTINSKSKQNLRLPFIAGSIFLAIVIIILVVGQIFKNSIKGTIPVEPIAGDYIEEKRGNTSGNINNRGIAVKQDGWIYYEKDRSLYKMRENGNESTMLVDDFAVCLNADGNWIYYVSVGDGGIYKVRLNGTELTKISDDSAFNLNLVGDWLYYLAGGIYRIKIDGTGRTLIHEDRSNLCLCVVDGWIYYTLRAPLQSQDESWNIYKIRTDGSERTKLNDDQATNLNVYDGWIYYSIFDGGSSRGIYRMDTNGNNLTIISEINLSNLNVTEGWMYFNVPDDNGSLYKIRIDGSDYTKLNEDQSESIIIVGEWIFYNNWSDNKNLYRIRTDGSERQIVQ